MSEWGWKCPKCGGVYRIEKVWSSDIHPTMACGPCDTAQPDGRLVFLGPKDAQKFQERADGSV